MTNQDQNLINGLTKRLKVEPGVSIDFSHGQLRRAATFAVKDCGYEWALKVSVIHELKEHRSVREKLRILLSRQLLRKANQKPEFGFNFEPMQ